MPDADLLAPGHPLLDAVVDLTLENHRDQIRRGAVLVDDADAGTAPRVMVMLEHEVGRFPALREGTAHGGEPPLRVRGDSRGRRADSEFACPIPGLSPSERVRGGSGSASGGAPTLCGRQRRDVGDGPRHQCVRTRAPASVRARTVSRVERTREAVYRRLTKEINYWDNRAAQLQLDVEAGRVPKMNADTARRRADEYAVRLKTRLAALERERTVSALPPRVVGGAFVVPAAF